MVLRRGRAEGCNRAVSDSHAFTRQALITPLLRAASWTKVWDEGDKAEAAFPWERFNVHNEGAVLLVTGAHALCGQVLGGKSTDPRASKPIANSLVTCGWICEPPFLCLHNGITFVKIE